MKPRETQDSSNKTISAEEMAITWELAEIEDDFRTRIIWNMEQALHAGKHKPWMYHRGHFLNNTRIRFDHFKTARTYKKMLSTTQDSAEQVLRMDKGQVVQDLTNLLKENISHIDNPSGSFGSHTYGIGSHVFMKDRYLPDVEPTSYGATDSLTWSTDPDTGEKLFRSRRLSYIESGMYDVIDLTWGDMGTEPYLQTGFIFDGEEKPGRICEKNELRERQELLGVQALWVERFAPEMANSTAA